jgi:Ca-activated chloride channel homolog
MRLEHPWMLFLLSAPVVWMILNWRARSRRRSLMLRVLSLCTLIFALCSPEVIHRPNMAVAVLADTSASISDGDLKRESDLIHGMESARGDHVIRVIWFARSTGRVERLGGFKSWNLVHAPGPAGIGTDMEGAVREGIATLPAGRVRRIVLLSDGRENIGNVLRAAHQAKALAIPIDTIPLVDRGQPGLRLEMAAIPSAAFTAERFPIDFVVTSPRATLAEIMVSTQGKQLESSRVRLEEGVNRVRVATSLVAVGNVEISVAVHAGSVGELQFSQPLTVRPPIALLVSGGRLVVDPHLMRALAQFEVRRATRIPADLTDDRIVLLNNWSLQTISLAGKATLEKFVKGGGIAILINGRHQTIPKAGARQDALERMLPARPVAPETPQTSCFVIVLQRSSSMDGKKLELAKLAAREVVENLPGSDALGVLTFANTFEWVVPVHKITDKDHIDDAIEAVRAGGDPSIAPALAEALRHVLSLDVSSKHIILLTDGRMEGIDTLALARQAASWGVTISTVGLADHTNLSYLSRLAQWTGGEAYIINNPWELEPGILRDTLANRCSSRPAHSFEESVPKLGAQLVISKEPLDPRLIRWQYGRGRAEIFSSAAIRRVGSPEPSNVDDVWINAVSDLPRETRKVEITTDYDRASDEFVIDYNFAPDVHISVTNPEIALFGPKGFGRPLQIEKVSAAVFRAHVHCDHTVGMFRVLPLNGSSIFPQVRLYRHDQELDGAGPNIPLLRQVSQLTGARFNPEPGSILVPDGQTLVRKLQLWPALVVLAVLLFLVGWDSRLAS